MGKQGPCHHCGVTSTPLWRNGPPEKPVLCNACGSRWRTKGSLANYTPLHARAEPDGLDDYRIPKAKTISIKNMEIKVLKRNYDNGVNPTEFGRGPPDFNQRFPKGFDEETSNRSSSGSAVSNSESCAQYGSVDGSDLTGPLQPTAWDTMVPSRKRSCVGRPKPSPVEKLTRDLYTIWHEQQSSCLSASSEEDLLFESDKPMVSVEIGHGSVLIRHPSSIARDEESEASSLSIDNKQPIVNAQLLAFPGRIEGPRAKLKSQVINKLVKPANPVMGQERVRRDKDLLENLQMLAHHESSLCYIDLEDILNFDKFVNHLTYEEQQQLLKFLPSIDTAKAPDSIRNMFGSPQFQENLFYFQKLLADGLFDNSLYGMKAEDSRILKKFVLCNFKKSKWVEQYKLIEDLKGKNIINLQSEVTGELSAFAANSSVDLKRPRDVLNHRFSGAMAMIKSPRRSIIKPSYQKECNTNKDYSFSSLKGHHFSLHNNSSFQLGDTFNIGDGSCEQDLLLDVPTNSSFPQAELLVPTSSFGAQASASSSSVYPNFAHP